MAALSTVRERRNWWIHLLYVRQDYDECLRVVEEVLRACNGLAEYPLYIKGLIRRQQGQIAESLTLFQAAACLNPMSVSNLKQVARSLFLLGRHKAAIDVYAEAEKAAAASGGDWEIHHQVGLCHVFLKQYAEAEAAFLAANAIAKHDATYVQLSKLYALQEKHRAAADVLAEALEYSPENPELLTALGLLHLRLHENLKAFELLGASLAHDPRSAKTILAAGSIIQDNSDVDVALVKYRVAAVATPHSSQLWNNVGMCFFTKQKYVAAAACLKRALFLDPFEWIIAFNLGLVHLATAQYASAFHYLSAALNLKPDYAPAYMHLGVTMARLNDIDNACAAYDKAISLEADHMVHLNYAVSLFNAGQTERAREQFDRFEAKWAALSESARLGRDPDVKEQRDALAAALR